MTQANLRITTVTKQAIFKYLPQTSEKLVSVRAIFALMIKASKENKIVLEKVLCIHYLLCLQKDTTEIKA